MKEAVLRTILSVVYAVALTLLATVASRWMQDKGGWAPDVTSMVVTLTDDDDLARVGGHAQAKEDLTRDVVLPMRHPRLFFEGPASVRPPRGVLLHGPPGTGKTMLARAVARASGATFLVLDQASLESKYYGETPKILKAAFHAAKTAHAPCVIFMDEIDAMGRARRDSDEACVYSFKCELLRHMDGLEGHRVVVLACTNCVHSLDPALRRRFQRVLYLGPPDEEGRLAILRTLAADTSEAAVLKEVAKCTPHATGADLATLFQRASVLRMDARTLDRAVRRARDGSDLARRLGPIALDHWRAAARQSGVWTDRVG